MSGFDRFQEPEECKPRYDSEGDAVNCAECDQNNCEHWEDWNEEVEEDIDNNEEGAIK